MLHWDIRNPGFSKIRLMSSGYCLLTGLRHYIRFTYNLYSIGIDITTDMPFACQIQGPGNEQQEDVLEFSHCLQTGLEGSSAKVQ